MNADYCRFWCWAMGVLVAGSLIARGSWASTPADQAHVQSAAATTSVPNAELGRSADSPPPPEDIAPGVDITFKNSHPPIYPMAAVKQHHQGLVVLDVTIDDKGRVQDVRVERSSGWPELDEAAVDAAHGWRYEPGIFNDKPAGGIVRIPVDFRF
jgi:protein TonB